MKTHLGSTFGSNLNHTSYFILYFVFSHDKETPSQTDNLW